MYTFVFFCLGHFQGQTRQRSTKHCEGKFYLFQLFDILDMVFSEHVGMCILQVYLANLRLKGVGTDVLVTAYEPILIK